MAEVYGGLESYLAHLPAVRAEVKAAAERRAAVVRAVGVAHLHTGDFAASVKTEPGATDTVIYSDDPNVLSIEYGHQARDGSFVEGIHAFQAGLA